MAGLKSGKSAASFVIPSGTSLPKEERKEYGRIQNLVFPLLQLAIVRLASRHVFHKPVNTVAAPCRCGPAKPALRRQVAPGGWRFGNHRLGGTDPHGSAGSNGEGHHIFLNRANADLVQASVRIGHNHRNPRA